MHVLNLFLKSKQGAPVQGRSQLMLKRGIGILGDVSAIAGNPRQVLFVDAPTLQEFWLHPGDLRENVMIDSSIASFASGQILQIGNEALVRLMFRCEPCAALDTLQPKLSKRIGDQRGMLGMVIRDGQVNVGDRIQVIEQRFPAISDRTPDRFAEFVARIQPGTVVTTSNLLLALGLTASYYRVIPTLIKKAPAGLPVHRIVASNGSLMSQHMPFQHDALVQECAQIVGDRVSASSYWEPTYFQDLGCF